MSAVCEEVCGQSVEVGVNVLNVARELWWRALFNFNSIESWTPYILL